jgi:hypothetical protein
MKTKLALIALLLAPTPALARSNDRVEARIREALPALDACVTGRPLRAAARLRLRAEAPARVVRILGVSDPAGRACLKRVLEGLRYETATPADVVLAVDLGAHGARTACKASRRRTSGLLTACVGR